MTTPNAPLDPAPDRFPVLTGEQLDRLRRYGTDDTVAAGDVLIRTGQPSYDFIALTTASAEIYREATTDQPEAVIVEVRPGQFLGELNLLTGQSVYLSTRVTHGGNIIRIDPGNFRRLMDEDTLLSDVILTAYLGRRSDLQSGEGALSVRILGSALSRESLALRTWAARSRIAHSWFDIDTKAGRALAEAAGIPADQLPAVVLASEVLTQATPAAVAHALGLTYVPAESGGEVVDVVVVGAGPAGLAAAVYGASEGLSTVVFDAVGVGGQAGASSRIENYLGFEHGISGADLTGRAAVQALKFGAKINSPCTICSVGRVGAYFELRLTDGAIATTRTVVLATGARYRKLDLPRWPDFEGRGIYYAATGVEARTCATGPVTVIGGANSAGQAALFLAGGGCPVTLVVRASNLFLGMSAYLARRIIADPAITVRLNSEVTALHGDERLEQITVTSRTDASQHRQQCIGLFCFIGADPKTEWLEGIRTDSAGFIRTDSALGPALPADTWTEIGRGPLPFETSEPGIFAIGDVRAGSMKRVAAAVGDGASCIRAVHEYLGRSAM